MKWNKEPRRAHTNTVDWFWTKVQNQSMDKRTVFSTNVARLILPLTKKSYKRQTKNEPTHKHYALPRNEVKMNHAHKWEMYIKFYKNIEENLLELRLSDEILKQKMKAWTMKEKNKLDFIKVKNFWPSKQTVNKIKS